MVQKLYIMESILIRGSSLIHRYGEREGLESFYCNASFTMAMVAILAKCMAMHCKRSILTLLEYKFGGVDATTLTFSSTVTNRYCQLNTAYAYISS